MEKKADKATKRRGRVTFKPMPAGVFKTNCSAVIDEVQANSESIIITKRGKPVAKLLPASSTATNFSILWAAKAKSSETL